MRDNATLTHLLAWKPNLWLPSTHATLDALPDNGNNHTGIVVIAVVGYDAATHAKCQVPSAEWVGTCVQCSNLYFCCYLHVAWRHAQPVWVNACVRQGHAHVKELLAAPYIAAQTHLHRCVSRSSICCELVYSSSDTHSLESFVNLNYFVPF